VNILYIGYEARAISNVTSFRPFARPHPLRPVLSSRCRPYTRTTALVHNVHIMLELESNGTGGAGIGSVRSWMSLRGRSKNADGCIRIASLRKCDISTFLRATDADLLTARGFKHFHSLSAIPDACTVRCL
jgi:hypothetical protein